ncbi:MAG: hypothetical protein IKI48_04330, partial [Prevotella sp.]|nr:hypothetical protein [Prevotella sp.]
MKKRFDLFVIILSVGWLLALSACSDDDGPAGGDEREYKGIPLVILDTDMGSSTDDLFALQLLHRYEQEGYCRLLGVVVDREG